MLRGESGCGIRKGGTAEEEEGEVALTGAAGGCCYTVQPECTLEFQAMWWQRKLLSGHIYGMG